MGQDQRPRQALAVSTSSEPATFYGDRAFSFPLAKAFADQANADPNTFTHGLHSYPARMHPALAESLLKAFKPHTRDKTVLDPFCGSGTVLVEAMRSGWTALGSDLNPLALMIARVKTQLRHPEHLERFAHTLRIVADKSEERVRGRVPVRAEIPRSELEWYDIHILKELAGLLEEIRKVENEYDRLAMEVLFSAIVVKFSKQRSDTSIEKVEKRLRKGLVTEFFVRRGQELIERWDLLAQSLPGKTKRPKVVLSDALKLPNTLGGLYKCELILTSPPYGGTYDYVDHHVRRYPWLGIRPKGLLQDEIGARRNLSQGKNCLRRWDEEVQGFLNSMSQLLLPQGLAVLLIGDAQIDGQRVSADKQIANLAKRAELKLLAVASQTRPDQLGGIPRKEHLIALIKP